MISRQIWSRSMQLARPPRLLPRITSTRTLSLTPFRHEYPKEGVFQQDSPRYVPGFGSAPPSPHQPAPTYIDTPPKRSRFRPRWYNFLGAVFTSVAGFWYVTTRLALIAPYEEFDDDDDDEEALALCFEELDAIPLVQQLRSAEVRVDGEDFQPVWREWTAYQGFKDDGRIAKRLTTGPLGGANGVAAQKVFWNEQDQQMFLFIRFGQNVQGWPHAVHGGVISTICDEALGRAAIRMTEAKTAVTANLEIQFVDIVRPGQWHVMMVTVDPDKKDQITDRKKYVSGFLLCCGDAGPNVDGDVLTEGHIHAIAKGLFVVPKNVQLPELVDEF